jgi:hypothetical protein
MYRYYDFFSFKEWSRGPKMKTLPVYFGSIFVEFNRRTFLSKNKA